MSGEATRLPCYVDVALGTAGYDVGLTPTPAGVKVIWDDEHTLPTGDGPRSVDAPTEHHVRITGRTDTGFCGNSDDLPAVDSAGRHRRGELGHGVGAGEDAS